MLNCENPWVDVDKELPPCDGYYECTNDLKDFTSLVRRPIVGVCYYDGIGFLYNGIYRSPKYWRNIISRIKKYGPQKHA